MNVVRKILCPIDFTEHSEHAVKYAISFSKRFNIKPQILHVSTKPPEVYYRFFPDVTGYLKAVERDVQNQLKEFIQKFNVQLDPVIRYGTVYQDIIQFVEDENIDLIIMAAKGFSISGDQVLSTVTQKVIRKAECPVLAVYGKSTRADIKKILCPIDLSPRSYKGLLQAANLARKFKAKIYLLHVVELHEFEKREIRKYSSAEAFSKLSQLLMDEIQIPNEIKDLPIEKVIRRNIDAAAEIDYFASTNKIDLITLTTHGRGYWPRVLLGSVTEKVAQIAPCPVLTVRIKK